MLSVDLPTPRPFASPHLLLYRGLALGFRSVARGGDKSTFSGEPTRHLVFLRTVVLPTRARPRAPPIDRYSRTKEPIRMRARSTIDRERPARTSSTPPPPHPSHRYLKTISRFRKTTAPSWFSPTSFTATKRNEIKNPIFSDQRLLFFFN